MLPQVTEDFDLLLQVADGVVHASGDTGNRLGLDSRPGFELREVCLPAYDVLFSLGNQVIDLAELPAGRVLAVVERPHFVDPRPSVLRLLAPLALRLSALMRR